MALRCLRPRLARDAHLSGCQRLYRWRCEAPSLDTCQSIHPSRCCWLRYYGAGWHGIHLLSTMCTPCVTYTTRPFRSFQLPQYQPPLLSSPAPPTGLLTPLSLRGEQTHSQSLLKEARRRTHVLELWMLNESSHPILIHCADDTQPPLHHQSRLFPSPTSPTVLAHALRQRCCMSWSSWCLGVLGSSQSRQTTISTAFLLPGIRPPGHRIDAQLHSRVHRFPLSHRVKLELQTLACRPLALLH